MIQNADINVGPGHYKDLAPDELLVTSIFYTIQGEGPFAGKPAIFIRLAGCNRGAKVGMGCEFCDTRFLFSEGRRMSAAQIITMAQGRFVDRGPLDGRSFTTLLKLPMVVITGGEPMLQNNLIRVIPKLLEAGFPHVQIESNGDRMLLGLPFGSTLTKCLSSYDAVTLVVSPKVVIKKYHMPKLAVWESATALKFVISGDPESPYYDAPDWASDFPREVYLSPLAEYRAGVELGEVASAWDHSLIDPELTKRNYQRAAKLAMQRGFRISIQQHLFLAMP